MLEHARGELIERGRAARAGLVPVRAEPGLLDGDRSAEMPGYSCFLREGDEIFHTYSAFARGTEYVGNAYTYLDMTALGRQEDWEEPKGRVVPVRGGDPTFTS